MEDWLQETLWLYCSSPSTVTQTVTDSRPSWGSSTVMVRDWLGACPELTLNLMVSPSVASVAPSMLYQRIVPAFSSLSTTSMSLSVQVSFQGPFSCSRTLSMGCPTKSGTGKLCSSGPLLT